jgi:hypothetical protein
MPVIPEPLINGVFHDWSSIQAEIAGGVTLGLAEISYKWTNEAGEVWGTHMQILGHTAGQWKCEASMSLYLTYYDALIAKLGKGYVLKRFNIVVNHRAQGLPIVTDKIFGCRMKGGDKSFAKGTDASVVKVDLMPLFLTENGLSPIPNPLGFST